MNPKFLMLAISVAMFMAIKWNMLRIVKQRLTHGMILQWFLLTPTLDPHAFFFGEEGLRKQAAAGVRSGILSVVAGSFLIAFAVPWLAEYSSIIAGWSAVCGLILAMHFGLLHLIIAAWQANGRRPQPLMLTPWSASSPSDFWGKRWNTAFRDVAHQLILVPATKRFGSFIGLFLCFFFSGLIHELAISVPAGGGYGGPTIYFLIQWLSLIAERWLKTRSFPVSIKYLSLRVLVIVGVLGPAPILFHTPFLTRVILPLVGVPAHAD